MAVFAFVLGSLPERVKVLPTENYYYFRFVHNGVPYAGNIRLAASDRDEGKVHFGYFGDLPNEWRTQVRRPAPGAGRPKDVTVEKLDNLTYRVTHGARASCSRSTTCRRSSRRRAAFGPDEVFIGPVFDESASASSWSSIRKMKMFHYMLDETATVARRFVSPRKAATAS